MSSLWESARIDVAVVVGWTLRVCQASRGRKERRDRTGWDREIRAIVNGGGRRRGSSSEYVIDNMHTLSLGLCCALMNIDRAPVSGQEEKTGVDRKLLTHGGDGKLGKSWNNCGSWGT